MPRNPDAADPGPVPTEKAPRSIQIPLPAEVAAIIRRVNRATKIPISRLVAEVAASAELHNAVTAVMRRCHVTWKAGLDDPFREED